jgi:L-glutamine-phosphate cytidylyltransferase
MQGSGYVADVERVRTAVVLAAGLGSRMGQLTSERPKCLVCVGGVPILERLVVTLDEYGIERLVMVTGYGAGMIHDHIGERFGGMAVEYVVNPLFATTNTMYSTWLVRGRVDEPVLLIEGDVVFDGDLLAPLLQPDRVAVSRQLPWMNGTTVTLDASGVVSAFYSPPPGVYDKHCTDADHFMTVNITSLARDTWSEVHERLDRHVREGHTGYFHDVVFAEMTAAGSMALTAVILPAERWYEVDTPADRDAAELLFLRHERGSAVPGRPRLRRGVAR